jgi:hypothetical protein
LIRSKKFECIKNLTLFQKVLFVFLMIRALAAGINCFLPFDLPHIIRQTDTISVAMRYWSRWVYEPYTDNIFYPAVLNSGQSYGFMPMEFPILNMVTAPFFFFGPYIGKILACLFICFLVLFFTYINLRVWKNIKILGISAFNMILLFPIFSFSASIGWRFIPDFIAVQLCLIAIGLSWEKVTYIKPFFLTLLGLLLKPVTVVVFPLFLLNKNIFKSAYNLFWLVPATLLSFLYYTKGIAYLEKLREIPTNFGVHKDIGLSSLIDLFSHYNEFLEFINYHPLFPYGIVLVSVIYLFYIIRRFAFYHFQLWIVILIQIIMIGILDGTHSIVHFYYWFGIAPSFCLLALGTWDILSKDSNYFKIFLKVLFFGIFVARFFEVCYFDTRLLFHPDRRVNTDVPFVDCFLLKNRNPEFPWNKGYVFFSENTEAPYLGACFGERTNYPSENLQESFENPKLKDKYRYGLITIKTKLPHHCNVIDRSGKVVIIKCDEYTPPEEESE